MENIDFSVLIYTLMRKYEKSELTKKSLERFYQVISIDKNISFEESKRYVRDKIISKLFKSNQLQEKIKGMLYRNRINQYSQIGDDVLQATFLELSRYNIDDLFLAYCDNPDRILGLAVTITKRVGFGKMNTEVSPNQSIAKQILFASNLNKLNFISTTEGTIYYEIEKEGTKDVKTRILEFIPEELSDNIDVWKIILAEIDDDEKEFLEFILNNVFNKKYLQNYGEELRRKFYSYNEYKVRRISLQNKIREILEKNKIKYG